MNTSLCFCWNGLEALQQSLALETRWVFL